MKHSELIEKWIKEYWANENYGDIDYRAIATLRAIAGSMQKEEEAASEKTLGNTDVNGAHKYDLLKGTTPIAQGAKMPWRQPEEIGKYEALGKAIGALVDVKNAQYGDAFHKTGKILAILYPEGVTPEQYDDMLAVVRVLDKLFRVANGKQGDEDPFKDIAGYGLLGMGE